MRIQHISILWSQNTCSTCGRTKTEVVPKGTNGGGGGGPTLPQPEYDSRWNLNFTEYGYTFRDTLANLIKNKVTNTTTYNSKGKGDDCFSIGKAAAANGSGKYTPFYHGSDYAVSLSAGANREHTWPNSRGGGEKAGGSNVEDDPFMVRPTITADNSDRDNFFYGLAGKSGKEWDPASCGFEAARGESARVIFYVATKFGKSNDLTLSNNPGDATSKKTMGTLKYLIQWNKQYPVTAMEKQINNYLDEHGFGRNPFVDHPEYADYIWNANGVVTSAPTSITIGGGGATYQEGSYTLKDALQDIDNAYIVSTADGTNYRAATATIKSDKLPWYLNVVNATVSSDKATCKITGDAGEEFKFSKQSDGSYTIQSSENKYIYNYIDGEHHSIGLCDTTSAPKSGTVYWDITKSDKGFIIKSKTFEVYLTISDQESLCGSSKAPTNPIYLYKKDATTTGGNTGGSTGGNTGGNTGGSTGGNTGGNTGGGTTGENSTFAAVTSLDALSSAIIVSSADSSSFFAMTTTPKESGKPFYLLGTAATLSSDKSTCETDGSKAETFKFTKQSDGTYTIQSSDNKYLFGYIEKSKSTYNSIQFTDSVSNTKINNNITSSTAYWDITAKDGGYAVKAHGIEVYFEYHDGRFCGYKSAPSTLVYFYSTNVVEA